LSGSQKEAFLIFPKMSNFLESPGRAGGLPKCELPTFGLVEEGYQFL
jgi:hypothetical protein